MAHSCLMVRLLAFPLCLLLSVNTAPLARSTGETRQDTPPAAALGPCGAGKRISCVVDGDTFWLSGTKIRIADINTPETSRPGCAAEAGLGARATLRLTQLLNAGPFMLERQGRDEDRYGRKLRVVTRHGNSLGDILVAEGLAERWTGHRRDWCSPA